MRSASSISGHSLLLEEEPVTHDSLPNFQEDVSMLRHSLENLGRSRRVVRQRNTCKLCCESLNSQFRDEHLAAETGVMATCHPSLPSDSSGRNKVWNFTSSGFILSHSVACLCDATTGACDEDRRACWLRSVFQHDSYLQQLVCVRWFHHLCIVQSCRRVDCVEATRFLSATGVGLLISVASSTFVSRV